MIDWLPRVVLEMVGCPGTVAGVPDAASDEAEVPAPFTASTVTG